MDVDGIVTKFCKKTKTVGVTWTTVCQSFLKENPSICQEDFELSMLRQGKRAAETMRNLCIKSEKGGSSDLKGIVTEAFWEACIASLPIRRTRFSVSAKRTRAYHRKPTAIIYMTVFKASANEYPEDALDLLKRFINSLQYPLQVLEYTNPRRIEIREIQR